MGQLLAIFFQIGAVVFLLVLGYGVGHYREVQHLRELRRKEHEFGNIGVTSLKKIPGVSGVECRELVTGCVVVATDYFKVFASALRSLFGGELRSFETLVRRARREAIVRMLAEAKKRGANAVINVRLETSAIGGQQAKKPGGVEALAYGTALTVPE